MPAARFVEASFLPVPYAPATMAVVHITHHHMMPVERTASLTGDFFGLLMAEATVLAASQVFWLILNMAQERRR
jgi:hypothetical protein